MKTHLHNGARSLSVRSRLILALALPVLTVVGVAIALCLVASRVNNNVRRAKDDSAVYARLAQNLKLEAVQVQQFLSDVSATRARDGLDAGLAEAARSAAAFLDGLARFHAKFERENNAAGVSEIARIRAEFEAYYSTGKTMADAYIANGPSGGNKLMGAFDESVQRLMKPLDGFVEAQTSDFTAALRTIESETSLLRDATVAAAILVLLLCSIVLVYVTRSIVRPLRGIAESLTAASEQTSAAATQVSASSQSLADRASEQAASLEETSASLEQMSSVTARNAESAGRAREVASGTRAAAEAGGSNMVEMKQAMDAIKASADEISKIIRTIDEIAFQTNILALNAAVEAARAGEAGAGFAVVADEVRNLAQRSAQSAKETAAKIEDSMRKSENGVHISAEVARSLDEIVAKAREMDELVAEIATASREQTQGIAQVNTATAQLDSVTQANAASAEETAAAAEELNAQAKAMEDVTADLRRLIDGTSVRSTRHEATVATIGRNPRRDMPVNVPPARRKAAVAPRNRGNACHAADVQHGEFADPGAHTETPAADEWTPTRRAVDAGSVPAA